MKVLWVTCHRPDPAGAGGEAYEFALIREASRRHELTVMSSGVHAGEAQPHLSALGVDVIGVGTPQRPVPANRATLLGLMLRERVPVTVWRYAPCADALRRAVAVKEPQIRPDLIQVWPSEITAVAGGTRATSALILTDCFTRQAARERALATTRRQQVLWALEHRNARRWERSAFGAPAALACVSAVDEHVLEELSGRPLDVIPVALGDEWFDAPTVRRSATDIVFVAALDYRPNVDAVDWLARALWPRIRERCPEARLHVVGRNPVPEVVHAVEACGAELHANVPDVRPWLWRAAVALSPVRLGSGMRNKILHAMACGAPLVGTAASTEGIGGRADVELLLAEDPEGFAASVHRLLTEPELARGLADRAAALARGYTSSAVGPALEQFWARAMADPRPAPA